MKSKKKEKNIYKEVEVYKKETKYYDRKAIQAEIDIDKKIRALLEKNAYNLNQIAGMLMVHLERVKKVNHERRKTNT